MLTDHMPPHHAAALAARHTGQAVVLLDRYDHGSEGAYRATTGDVPCVFKYWSGERANALRLATAVRAHDDLQQCGWPLPSIYCWRSVPHFAFVLEEQMPGRRTVGVSAALCGQLLALLAAAPPGAGSSHADTAPWLATLEQSLYHDLPLSPCRPRAVQRSAMGGYIVVRARTAFAAARPALAAACDVIHGDFSAGNILIDDGGALAALLDWQHGCVGHRGFDLVGLEWDLALRLDVGSAPSLSMVTAYVNDLVEEPVRAFCRAYYGVWNLSWALDTLDEEQVLRAAAVVGIT
jgi:Ser/Thr protein kinase RdoA (MazF antagonist)